MGEIDLKKYNIHTDLVVDLLDGYNIRDGERVDNVEIDGIKVSDVVLDNDNVLNKKKGHYVTIFFDDVTDTSNRKRVEKVFIKYLKELIKENNLTHKNCLVVGLGNYKSTPDALGPKVVENVLVTRYLFLTDGVEVDKSFSNVSAISPGVLATTGIETSEIIRGITEKINIDFILVVDALASSSLDRINKTIQISDAGIEPGSGVGNKRRAISKETLNVPVIVIGVPTVIDGVTIVSDTIKYMMKKFSYSKENIDNNKNKLIPITSINYLDYKEELTIAEREKLLGLVGNLNDDDMKQLIFEVLTPIGYNLIVTSKEIDFIIDKLSLLLSDGINKSLHDEYVKR